MLFLILLRAYLTTRSEVGNVLGKGYKLVVQDGTSAVFFLPAWVEPKNLFLTAFHRHRIFSLYLLQVISLLTKPLGIDSRKTVLDLLGLLLARFLNVIIILRITSYLAWPLPSCRKTIARSLLCGFRWTSFTSKLSFWLDAFRMHNSLQSILCARLLLRLRKAYDETRNDVATLSTWQARPGEDVPTNMDFMEGSLVVDGILWELLAVHLRELSAYLNTENCKHVNLRELSLWRNEL